MALRTDRIEKARVVSGLTLEEAASVVGLKSYQTYRKREQFPGTFTVDELNRLYNALDEDGKQQVKQVLSIFFGL